MHSLVTESGATVTSDHTWSSKSSMLTTSPACSASTAAAASSAPLPERSLHFVKSGRMLD